VGIPLASREGLRIKALLIGKKKERVVFLLDDWSLGARHC